ncbi:MAG: hypothetical protein IPJ24_15850 [bacterium]|nr:hypothetical protein [bacterium]
MAFNAMVADYRDLEAKVARIKELRDGRRHDHARDARRAESHVHHADRSRGHPRAQREARRHLDLIDAAAHRLLGYRIEAATPDLVLHAQMLIADPEMMRTALLLPDNMKHHERIIGLCPRSGGFET